MLRLLFREKPLQVLLALKNTETPWHVSKLARQSDTTYVHLVQLLPKMQEQGWIKMEKKGKKRMVTLTEKGMGIAQLLEELKRKIEPPKEGVKQPAA